MPQLLMFILLLHCREERIMLCFKTGFVPAETQGKTKHMIIVVMLNTSFVIWLGEYLTIPSQLNGVFFVSRDQIKAWFFSCKYYKRNVAQ
jgi:hypothetical protein